MNQIIKPDTPPGWSAKIEPLTPNDELLTEFDAQRGLLVIRMRKYMEMPVHIPIPLPAMLGICGMILTAMASGAVGEVTAHMLDQPPQPKDSV